jgi:hypothetical protein
MKPGIHTLTNDEYHSGPGVSKTGLFKLHKRTPFHFRFSEQVETEKQKFGNAAHTAVLEPNLFEDRYMRGPADRRGNKWGAAVEMAQAAGKICVTEDDYDNALRLRDALHRDVDVRKLTAGAPAIEQSAYAIDEETSELVRVRPDIHNHDMRTMADLKATVDASAWQFAKRVDEFGYHVQEAIYTDVWSRAGGGDVNAFVFIVVEDKPPFAYRLYELEPSAVEEGRAIYRSALATYHECMEKERQIRKAWSAAAGPDLDAMVQECWPMYGTGVASLDLPAYGYRLTKREME